MELEEDSVQWYKYGWEHSYLEMITLVILTCLALVFEVCFHQLMHAMEHTYLYGDEHANTALVMRGSSRHVTETRTRHRRLFKEFVSRVAGEFMSLGFLGLSVFIFNFIGGFDILVEKFHSTDDLHLPESVTEYAHFVELVHIKLFLGMAMYFVLVFRVVSGGVRQVRKWEQLNLQRIEHATSSGPTDSPDPDFDKYLRLRGHFLFKLSDWQRKEPTHFRETCRMLGMCATSEGAQRKLDLWLHENFSFSEYLAINVEHGVCDSIEVHPLTWLVVLLIMCSFAVIDRLGRLDSIGLGTPICILLAFGMLASMQWLAVRKHRRILDRARASGVDQQLPISFQDAQQQSAHSDESMYTEKPAAHIVKNLHRHYNTEMITLRVLQIVLFLISYFFASTLLDLDGWRLHAKRTWLYTAGFVLLFSLLSYSLPSSVPTFLALMALPPYMDDDNLKMFFSVLAGDVHQHRCRPSDDHGLPQQVADESEHDLPHHVADESLLGSAHPEDDAFERRSM
mmetsp:Transcript_113819/g.368306  ORF Transcript_113819/g.368306 Transcript_113819/m.368306 type:complete len:510 (-) Transcript_113819:748-2277(-)